MKREDFVKFYYENKDKQGFVHINKIAEHFRFNNRDDGVGIERIPTFLSSHGKYFLKFVFMSNELDAEILMPRVYEKLGFISCKNFPIMGKEGNTFIASSNVHTKGTVIADKYWGRIFDDYWNCFSHKEYLKDGFDTLTGNFTEGAIKDLLKLRLVDTASFNTDRHTHNFFYTTQKDEDGSRVATGIKTIDYGDSGMDYNRLFSNEVGYYHNFSYNGEEDCEERLTRSEMINEYKYNETSNMFLPKTECAQILGSVNFQKEAKDLQQETGYHVNQKLVDAWDKSFDNMAEELSK